MMTRLLIKLTNQFMRKHMHRKRLSMTATCLLLFCLVSCNKTKTTGSKEEVVKKYTPTMKHQEPNFLSKMGFLTEPGD